MHCKLQFFILFATTVQIQTKFELCSKHNEELQFNFEYKEVQ